MSKKLAIYFSDPEPMGDPFNKKYPYFKIFQDIIREVEKHNNEVYIVRDKLSYLGKGLFSHGWRIENGALIAVEENIKVDLIFHRGNHETIPEIYDCPMVNHPDLERFCDDKVKIAEVFADISPKTKAINSYQEFLETVAQWNFRPEDKIVLKKNFLCGGRGIYIKPVKEITQSLYETWDNLLMQEFIDSSVGIPGIVEGLHDIRVVTINGEPVYSFIRVPPSGSYLANVSQGGTEKAVPLEKLPADLLELVSVVNKKFAHYKTSVMSSDFFNSKDGFKLIELNAPPAVCDPEQSPETRKYIDKLVEFLVKELS